MRFHAASPVVSGLVLCAATWAQPAAPRRLALVIVNSAYEKLSPLGAPQHDGEVLREALQKTGFQVTTLANVMINAMSSGLDSFIKGINAGDRVLFFYSGHAVQSSSDDILLPVEFDPQAQGPLATRGVSLTRIDEDVGDRKPSVRIFLLDASRQEKRLAALPLVSGSGLALIDVMTRRETATICSAPLNQTVPEPPAGSAGALATVFSKLIQQPGSSLDHVKKGVQDQVHAPSGSEPFAVNQVSEAFYFVAPPPPPPKPASTTTLPPVDPITRSAQINRSDRLEYRFIAKGTFLMGCVPGGRKQDQCEPAEKPQHQVTLTRDVWIGATDVTNDAYARFVNADKSRKKPPAPFWEKRGDYPDHPVVNVNWEDARTFCAWVGGRLPTEAEWEYAARAGKANEVYPLNQENSRDRANFSGTQGNDIYPYTSPVKKFDPNPWGLFDMAGNVWQWTADWFDANYYQSSPAEDPPGPASGSARVARGGSFQSDPAKHLRISFREKFSDPKGSDHVGFRCVLEDSPATRSRFSTR